MSTVPSALLSLRTFGSLSVTIGGEPMPGPLSKKGQMLLVFLALHANREIKRKQIAVLLWPNSPEEQALYNLRRTLIDLREALGPACDHLCSVTKQTLRLTLTREEADVVAFDHAARRCAPLFNPRAAQEQDSAILEHLVSLHTGVLCADWENKSGEQWILPEREIRKMQCCQALEVLCTIALNGRRCERALGCLEQLAGFNDIQEERWQGVMQGFLDGNDFRGALLLYRRLEDYLRPSGMKPGLAMRSLYRLAAKQPPAEQAAETQSATPRVANLPYPLTRFFGREEERDKLCRETRGAKTRLLTLIGAGGIGKSRLVVETARLLAPRFPRRAWFVPLADLREAEALLFTIAGALSLKILPGQEPLSELAAFLNRKKPALLILDNFERLVTVGAYPLQALLQQVPSLTVIVTSRIALGIPGERFVPVSPLPLPPNKFDLDVLAQVPSVRLLVDRIRGVNPNFALTEHNAYAVSEICKRLEGIPLALELVAAWGWALTPSEMQAQLEARFTFLAYACPPSHARHPSLHAALSLSYELLSSSLQSLFRQLSVFRGGFSREAAGTVSGSPETLDGLNRLGAHSLLSARDVDGKMRFTMLETLREFGQEELNKKEREEEREAALCRHADYYDDKLQKAGPHLTGANGIAWLDWMDREYANIETALGWELQNTSQPRLLRRQAIHSYWHLRRPITAVREWLRGFLAPTAPAIHPFMRAKVLVNLGGLSVSCGEFEQAEDYLLEGRAYFRDNGHQDDELGSITNLAYLTQQRADYPMALVYAQEGLARAEEQKRPDEQALHWKALAHARMHLKDFEGAKNAFANARALYAQLGEKERLLALDLEAGLVFHLAGDNARAIAHWQQGLERARLTADAHSIGSHLLNIGRAQQGLKEWKAAKDHYREALCMFQRLGQLAGIALVIAAAAELMLAEGQIETAGYYVGVAENIWRQAGRVNAPYRQEIFAMLWENPMFQSKREQGSSRAVAAELVDLDAMPFSF